MTKTPEQIRRAHELLDHIEAHPESHDQNWWITTSGDRLPSYTAAKVLNQCGTTACAAGWTVLLAGGVTVGTRYVKLPDGTEGHIWQVAGDLLGLDEAERYELLYQATDLADVRKAISYFFGPRPDGI